MTALKIKKQHRFVELDALRGFAAVAVGIWHTSIMVLPHGFTDNFDGVSLLNMGGISTELYLWRIFLSICNAPIAVNMFFIISGFVLYGMLNTEIGNKDIWSGIKRFYVRRIVRLYIPVFFAVTFIYLVTITFGAYLGLINYPIHDYLSNIILGGRHIDMVTWTIKIEILASILFPLMYLTHNAVKKWVLFDLLILLFFIYIRVESPDKSLQSFLLSPIKK